MTLGRAHDAGAIVRLARAGRLREARAQADRVIARSPPDAALLHLAGVLAAQDGDPVRGAELLGRAAGLRPADADLARNLARALIDAGRAGDALKVCGRHVAAPGFGRLEAEALRALDRHSEAAARYRVLVAAAPGDVELWNNLGSALLASDAPADAIVALERARALAPRSATVLTNLARAEAATGAFAAGLAHAEAATEAAPGDAAALLELGRALNRAGRHDAALIRLADAARAAQDDPEVFVALGQTYAYLGELDRAEQGYLLATRMTRLDPQAWVNLAVLYEQGNRVEDLAALVENAGLRGVGGSELAYMQALSLRRAGRFEDALDLMLSAAPGAIDEGLRQQLIGQLADRLGEAETAFAAFTAMNQAMMADPSAAGYDGTEHRRFVESLDAMTTPEWVASWPAVHIDAEPPSPVFLVGFPRSGTTLLDTVLMGHPDTHVLEEEPILVRVRDEIGDLSMIPAQGEAAVNELRALYFAELERIAPAAPGKLVIDKLPLNILRAPLVHRLFPDAKFIFASRHPCDCVLSCFMQNFRVNQAMASFLTIENAALLYDRVLRYWETCRAAMPLTVHTIRYEDMVADLEGEMRPLLAYLGLAWTDAVLDHTRTAGDRGYIRTPSYAQVTERIYARSRGRWEKYREQLAPILPILEPWAERLGYGSLDPA